MILLSAFALGCASPPPRAPSAGALEPVAFLEGDWTASTPEGEVREHWGPPSGDAMLGSSHTVKDGRTVFFEFMRVEARPTGLVFLASPMGRDPPSPFPLVEAKPGRVVFANPAHDFPQRIRYEQTGDRLEGRIEGNENGKPRVATWSYARAK